MTGGYNDGMDKDTREIVEHIVVFCRETLAKLDDDETAGMEQFVPGYICSRHDRSHGQVDRPINGCARCWYVWLLTALPSGGDLEQLAKDIALLQRAKNGSCSSTG